MRLIDVVLNCWCLRQALQSQYESSLPHTVLNTAYLETLADAPRKDRSIEKPDHLARRKKIADKPADAKWSEYEGNKEGEQLILREDVVERQPYTLDAHQIDPALAYEKNPDGSLKIVQDGVAPIGGRRHVGIEIWLWLVERLKRVGIVLELDSDEYAA
jgi:hypothetical protein